MPTATRSKSCTFIGGGAPDDAAARADDDPLVIAGRTFHSRLIIGTGKYKDYEENRLAAEAAGSEMITVAVRRVNLTDRDQPMLVDYLDPKKYTYLPNTAGCFTADDALRTLQAGARGRRLGPRQSSRFWVTRRPSIRA